MEDPTQNYKEKKKQFDRKTFIVNELKRVTQDFNDSFPILTKIYEQEAKVMLKIQDFTRKFYNKDCIYKQYTQQYSNITEKEADHLNTIANSYKNVGNFNLQFLRSFDKFEKQKKLVLKRLEKEQHYVKKVFELENRKEKNEIMNKVNTKKYLNKIERNKRKRQVATKEVDIQLEDFNESFLGSVKERFQLINPYLKEFIIKKKDFYQKMNELYQDIVENISILEMEDNFEDYKDNIFQSRIENMSRMSGFGSEKSLNDSINIKKLNLRSNTASQQIQPQHNIQQFQTISEFNFQKKMSPQNTIQTNEQFKNFTQSVIEQNQTQNQFAEYKQQQQQTQKQILRQNSQEISNQNQNILYTQEQQNNQINQQQSNQQSQQFLNQEQPIFQNQQNQFQNNNSQDPFDNLPLQQPNFNNEPFTQFQNFSQPQNNDINNTPDDNNQQQNTQIQHYFPDSHDNLYDEFGNPVLKGRNPNNQIFKKQIQQYSKMLKKVQQIQKIKNYLTEILQTNHEENYQQIKKVIISNSETRQHLNPYIDAIKLIIKSNKSINIKFYVLLLLRDILQLNIPKTIKYFSAKLSNCLSQILQLEKCQAHNKSQEFCLEKYSDVSKISELQQNQNRKFSGLFYTLLKQSWINWYTEFAPTNIIIRQRTVPLQKIIFNQESKNVYGYMNDNQKFTHHLQYCSSQQAIEIQFQKNQDFIDFSFSQEENNLKKDNLNSNIKQNTQQIQDTEILIQQELNDTLQKLDLFYSVVENTNQDNYDSQINKIMYLFSVFNKQFFLFQRVLKKQNLENIQTEKLQNDIEFYQQHSKDLSQLKDMNKNDQNIILNFLQNLNEKYQRNKYQIETQIYLYNNDNILQKDTQLQNDYGFDINDFSSNQPNNKDLTIIQEVEETQFDSYVSTNSLNKTAQPFGSFAKLNVVQNSQNVNESQEKQLIEDIEYNDFSFDDQQFLQEDEGLLSTLEFVKQKKEKTSNDSQQKKNFELQSTKDYEEDKDSSKKNQDKFKRPQREQSTQSFDQIQIDKNEISIDTNNKQDTKKKSSVIEYINKKQKTRPLSLLLNLNLKNRKDFQKSTEPSNRKQYNFFEQDYNSLNNSFHVQQKPLFDIPALNLESTNTKNQSRIRRYSLNQEQNEKTQNCSIEQRKNSTQITNYSIDQSKSVQQTKQLFSDRKMEINRNQFYMRTLDDYSMNKTHESNTSSNQQQNTSKLSNLKVQCEQLKNANQVLKTQRQQIDTNYKQQIQKIQSKQKSFKKLLKICNKRENKLKNQLQMQHRKNQKSQQFIQELKQKLNYYDCKLQAMKLMYKDIKNPLKKTQNLQKSKKRLDKYKNSLLRDSKVIQNRMQNFKNVKYFTKKEKSSKNMKFSQLKKQNQLLKQVTPINVKNHHQRITSTNFQRGLQNQKYNYNTYKKPQNFSAKYTSNKYYNQFQKPKDLINHSHYKHQNIKTQRIIKEESQKEIQLDQEDDVVIEVSSTNSSFINLYNQLQI